MKKPYLDTVIYDDFYELLKGRFESSAEKPALRFCKDGGIVSLTYREMIRQIAAVFRLLKEQGLTGKHIAILSENRYEYIIIYLATIFGSVIVPLDKELDAGTIADCIDRFDIGAVFCTERTIGKVTDAAAAEGTKENGTGRKECRILRIEELFATIGQGPDRIPEFLEEVKDTDKDRFAVLATTSGTDGRMKGVMLSQYNIITNIRGTLENNILKDPTLAFLPMNHTYGFNPCILATLYNGTTVCLCTEIKYLMRDIRTFDPFFFGAVPLVIEGMYHGMMREIRRRGKEKAFARLLKLSDLLRKIGLDLRHLFFGRLFAPHLRLVVSGGAALRKEYVELFDRIGITILNGYGLTECSPTIAVSRTSENVPGSAGTIMKHIEVKTAEDGELLVKGPCVMLGYYGDEAATRACMRDGYFATGDLGYTKDRLIYVTGRKKNLIVLENGKNISPEYLEERLGRIPGVKESIVTVKRTASGTEILSARVVKEEGASEVFLGEGLAELNRDLPTYMRIEDMQILSQPFEKNSSGKIRRTLYDT